MTASPQPAAPTGLLGSGKVAAYVRLAKLDIFDYYLGLLVVWSLLPVGARLSGRVLLTLLLFLVSEVLVVAAAVAFDDVQGYLDGSDATNYGPDAPARRLARKPLLTGELTVSEARQFGWAMVVGAVVTSAAAIAVAPVRPVWAVAVALVCLVVAVQYSWGLKLSYHGLGEVVLAGVGVAWVMAPYGLVAGTAPGFLIVQALVFGMGPMLFGLYSNTNDVRGDTAAKRSTAAATLSARGNRGFVIGMSLLQMLIIVGAPAVGLAPWWFPLAMLPMMALRARQLAMGLEDDVILTARKLGITIHRVAVATLVVVNLFYVAGGGLS